MPLALNVPPLYEFGQRVAGLCEIVLVPQLLDLSDVALIGLMAHEVAHSVVGGETDDAAEAVANTQVEKWGFAPEYAILKAEEEKLFESAVTAAGLFVL